MDADETRAFVDLMDCEHRTRQQGFGRLVVEWIKGNAAKMTGGAGGYDLRNEATVKLCHAIVEQVDSARLALPFL